MTRIAKGLVCALAVLFVGSLLVDRAAARPQYCKEFIEHYKGVKEAAATKCGICHPGQEKKEKNNYGTCLSSLLAKNEKDPAKIKEALEKAEGAKSAVEGKTFGDLLKDGKLPGSK
ncbi:MAG: hypothetical protein U0935_13385 [Pirellulales bacterium]